jgi:hypothetical protein
VFGFRIVIPASLRARLGMPFGRFTTLNVVKPGFSGLFPTALAGYYFGEKPADTSTRRPAVFDELCLSWWCFAALAVFLAWRQLSLGFRSVFEKPRVVGFA